MTVDFMLVLVILIVAAIAAAVGYLLSKGQGGKHNQQQLDDLNAQFREAQDKNLILETQSADHQKVVDGLESRLQEREQQLDELQQHKAEQAAKLSAMTVQLEEQAKANEEKLKLLDEARKQLGGEFELLANKIFDEKQQRFSKDSKNTLDTAITPLKEQLKDFRQKVEDVYDKDSKERVSLVAQLDQLKQLNQQMSTDALNLTKALKGDNKAQGNWGEVILERVLEESGLHKGREYQTQVSLKSPEGRQRFLDVIVHLPEQKDIIIDSKVSLVHYERYCNAEDEQERQQALKEHVASVKGHINQLSIKDYENLSGIRTLDFVFIFIPIESAFMAAFEHDQSIFSDAYNKNIIVVSPTTLLATLRTVQSIWRYEHQNKNAEEIARQAGAMHDKFVGFVESLEEVAKHIQKADKAHEDAVKKLISGKGNLVSSTQRLEKLGAKVKKSIPDSMLVNVEDSDDENDGADILKLHKSSDPDN